LHQVVFSGLVSLESIRLIGSDNKVKETNEVVQGINPIDLKISNIFISDCTPDLLLAHELFRESDPLLLSFDAEWWKINFVFLDSVCIEQSKEKTSLRIRSMKVWREEGKA
jgi:hypothetical protein